MFSGLGAAALSTIGGSLATLYTNKANAADNIARFNAETELANTAHQREVNDLRLAGLNPILSAGGAGASVPSTAPYERDAPPVGSLAGALASAASADLSTAQAEKMQGDIARSQFLERFYKTPLGHTVAENQAIKAAVPDNPIQMASMAAMRMNLHKPAKGGDVYVKDENGQVLSHSYHPAEPSNSRPSAFKRWYRRTRDDYNKVRGSFMTLPYWP